MYNYYSFFIFISSLFLSNGYMFASSKPVTVPKYHLEKDENFKYEPKSFKHSESYSSLPGDDSLSDVGTTIASSGTPRIPVSEEENSPVDIEPFDVDDFFTNDSSPKIKKEFFLEPSLPSFGLSRSWPSDLDLFEIDNAIANSGRLSDDDYLVDKDLTPSPVPSSRISAFGSNYGSSAIAQPALLPFQMRKISLSDEQIIDKAERIRNDFVFNFTGAMSPEDVAQILKKNDMYEQYDEKTRDTLVSKISDDSKNIEGIASIMFKKLEQMPNFYLKSIDDPLATKRYLKNALWSNNSLRKYISDELCEALFSKFQKKFQKINYSKQESRLKDFFSNKAPMKEFKESTLAYRKRITLNVAEQVSLQNQLLRSSQKLSEQEQKSIIDTIVADVINEEFNRQANIEQASVEYFMKELSVKDKNIPIDDFLKSFKNEIQQIIEQGIDPQQIFQKVKNHFMEKKDLTLQRQKALEVRQKVLRQSEKDAGQAAMEQREANMQRR